jgi:hypothetical protein
MKNFALFIITLAVVFTLYFIPKNIIPVQLVQKAEYFELFFGAILIVFLFGYFQYLITNNSEHLENGFQIGILFIIWYYLWKFITNYANLDKNNIVRFN